MQYKKFLDDSELEVFKVLKEDYTLEELAGLIIYPVHVDAHGKDRRIVYRTNKDNRNFEVSWSEARKTFTLKAFLLKDEVLA